MATKLLAILLFLMTAIAVAGWYFAVNPEALPGTAPNPSTPQPSAANCEDAGPENVLKMEPPADQPAEDPLVIQTRQAMLRIAVMACGNKPSDQPYCTCMREEVVNLSKSPEFTADLKANGPFDQQQLLIALDKARRVCVIRLR